MAFLLIFLLGVGGILAVRGGGSTRHPTSGVQAAHERATPGRSHPEPAPRSEPLGCVQVFGITVLVLFAFVIFFFVTCVAFQTVHQTH
jgi:hypothetical protein